MTDTIPWKDVSACYLCAINAEGVPVWPAEKVSDCYVLDNYDHRHLWELGPAEDNWGVIVQIGVWDSIEAVKTRVPFGFLAMQEKYVSAGECLLVEGPMIATDKGLLERDARRADDGTSDGTFTGDNKHSADKSGT